MRTRDYARSYVKTVGDYQLVKRPWEKSIGIFYKGRCVDTVRTKSKAIKYIQENNNALKQE